MFLSYAANDHTSSSNQSPTIHSRSQSFTNKSNDASSLQQKKEVTNYKKYVYRFIIILEDWGMPGSSAQEVSSYMDWIIDSYTHDLR